MMGASIAVSFSFQVPLDNANACGDIRRETTAKHTNAFISDEEPRHPLMITNWPSKSRQMSGFDVAQMAEGVRAFRRRTKGDP